MAKNIKDLTLKWVMADDKIVRFNEIEEPFDMSDTVAKLDFDKAGISDGTKVTVEFENKDGKDVVIFLTKTKGATQPEPSKVEAPKAEQPKAEAPKTTIAGNVKTLTVGGLSPKYKGITFKEEDKVWYDVVSEIGIENLEKMGIVRGSSVEVTIADAEGKSKNKRIVGIKLAEKKEAPKTDTKPDPRNDFDNDTGSDNPPPTDAKDAFYRVKELERTVRYLKDGQQASIEAQGAVERAFTLVGAMIAKEPAEANVKNTAIIKGLLKDYAQEAYSLVQLLKQSKV